MLLCLSVTEETSGPPTLSVVLFDKKSFLCFFFSSSASCPFIGASSSDIYGQTFLCISLPSGTFNDVAEVLRVDGPYVYASVNVDSLKSEALNNVVNGDFVDGTIVKTIQSAALSAGAASSEEASAAAFTVFGKSRSWGQDLYEDLVEPTLDLPFRWETWRRSGASIFSPLRALAFRFGVPIYCLTA